MTDESQISEREREILRLVATGATNQQIAQQLHISINTVKVHLRNIFGKIGAASRTEATLYAVRSGLVTVERAGATAVAEGPDEAPAEPPALQAPPAVAPPAPLDLPPAADVEPDPAPAEDVQAMAVVAPTAPVVVAPPVPAAPLAEAPAGPVIVVEPAAVGPRSPAPAARPGLNPLVIGLAVVALLAVGGLIAVLLARPAPPAATPTADPAASLPAPGQRWRAVAPVPAPRADFALVAAAFDGSSYLYLLGGEGPEGVTGEVLRLDLAGNSWARYTAKPTPVADVQGAVIGGKIYVPGGRAADGSISAALEVYDPQADRWTKLAAMPAPRSRYALAAVEGKLYLFGGWDGADYAAQVWQYTPDTDRWAELTAMPAPRAGAAAVELGGQIYVIGGENRDGALARHDRYSPSEEGQGNPWSVRAPLPAPRSGLAAAGTIDRIFVFGGAGGALAYDSSRDVWEPVELPSDLALRGLGAEFVGNGKVYIVGGRGDAGLSADAFEYQALFVVTLPVSRGAP
jgi:DNA-binding CsgD family transcriptional regulator/N-acetylneuraminic acid mutarotase